MRVEEENGRYLLCGHIIKYDQIKPGQIWANAQGKGEVVVIRVEDGWVKYEWEVEGHLRSHEKLAFAFQCRYFLVLESSEIPDELLQ